MLQKKDALLSDSKLRFFGTQPREKEKSWLLAVSQEVTTALVRKISSSGPKWFRSFTNTILCCIHADYSRWFTWQLYNYPTVATEITWTEFMERKVMYLAVIHPSRSHRRTLNWALLDTIDTQESMTLTISNVNWEDQKVESTSSLDQPQINDNLKTSGRNAHRSQQSYADIFMEEGKFTSYLWELWGLGDYYHTKVLQKARTRTCAERVHRLYIAGVDQKIPHHRTCCIRPSRHQRNPCLLDWLYKDTVHLNIVASTSILLLVRSGARVTTNSSGN